MALSFYEYGENSAWSSPGIPASPRDTVQSDLDELQWQPFFWDAGGRKVVNLRRM